MRPLAGTRDFERDGDAQFLARLSEGNRVGAPVGFIEIDR
jgi:hypothetical protein